MLSYYGYSVVPTKEIHKFMEEPKRFRPFPRQRFQCAAFEILETDQKSTAAKKQTRKISGLCGNETA